MVPAYSDKVSRVSSYSGYRHAISPFAYGTVTLCGRTSQNCSARFDESIMRSEPGHARTTVCPLPISLAATLGIDVSFSSSGYLDVSVHRVPFHTLCIGVWMTGVFPAGFPHSDISGSLLICSSPKLFAAYHVFHRLLVPRHPPCALIRLTSARIHSVVCFLGSLCLHCLFENINLTLIPSDVFSNFKILLYSVFKVRDFSLLRSGLKWTRTTDLTLIRRAL